LGESRGNLRKVFLQPDHDQDIISAEYEAIVGWHEKRSTKDRDETNRRREGYFSERFPNDECSMDDGEAFDGCSAKA
jgi:hypothetical protein